jgi:phosphate transport system substrate-binding protein
LKRNRLLVLATAVALTASLSTGLTAAASAATTLTGAGSTLVTPLITTKWAPDYQSLTGNTVTYGGGGSGAGITQITANAVSFGASDAPLTAAQHAACPSCVQIPWALTATGIAIDIPGVRKLNLSPQVLANIYLGTVTNWNDKSIAALNKGTALPNLAITPVYRSDASGDTYAFTDLESRASAAFRSRIGTSTTVSFPVGKGGKGNAGVAALVSSTPGSLAYIAASYIIANGLNAAALENRAGKFAYPNLRNIEAAAAAFPKVPASREEHIVYPPKKAKSAYPLSTYTYVIVRHDSTVKAVLQNFISYAIGRGQAFGASLDFAPIPKAVKKADAKAVSSL